MKLKLFKFCKRLYFVNNPGTVMTSHSCNYTFGFTLWFLLTLATGYAQDLDSLKQAYGSSNSDEQKIQTLHGIADYFINRNLDSSVYYNERALKMARSTDSDTLIASCLANLGTVYLMKGRLDVSMEYQLQALKLYPENSKNVGVYKLLNNIGLIYFYQSKFDEALVNYNKVLHILEDTPSIKPSDKERYLGTIFINIGIIYDIKTEYSKSLEFYSKAVTHSKNANDQKNLASAYSNMGLVYIKLQKYDLAESYFNEALEIRVRDNDTYGLCKSYQHLGNLYKEKGELERAEEILLRGLQKCEEANATKARAQVIEKLSHTYFLNNDYKNAYEYQLSFINLNDSLTNSETERKITEAEMQYKFDKETQEKEAQQQKQKLIYVIIGIVLILIIITIGGLFLLQKAKSKNQKLEKEKVDLENKELALRKQTLENELESRSKDLATNVMYLIKKNELISEISQRLITLKKQMKKDNQKDVQNIIMDLQTAKDDAIWDEFEVRFNQVYNDFYERLNHKFPDLTNNEKKICAFLKLNMTTKEICTLTRQSTNSLNVARTRLRKKLGIKSSNTNLTTFLENI